MQFQIDIHEIGSIPTFGKNILFKNTYSQYNYFRNNFCSFINKSNKKHII